MKSLRFMHSAENGGDSRVPPKLKTFNSLARKLSSVLRRGSLSTVAIASLLLFTPAALATGVLKLGMSGPAVAHLQAALGIPVDGVFGRQTKAAVIDFQRSCGLLVDGVAGPQTINALRSGRCGGSSISSCSSPCAPSCGDSCYEEEDYQDYDECVDTDGRFPCYPSSRINQQGNRFPSRAYTGGQYVVVVPNNSPQDLTQVRLYVPGAFPDATLAGGFINAGQFNDYATAARTVDLLEGVGFDAQVAYREYYD